MSAKAIYGGTYLVQHKHDMNWLSVQQQYPFQAAKENLLPETSSDRFHDALVVSHPAGVPDTFQE